MLKLVEGILKKHLDSAEARYYETQVEFGVIASWDVFWGTASFSERRAVAKELITAIRGVDLSEYRRIPALGEAKGFMRQIYPCMNCQEPDDYLVEDSAKALIAWLEYRKRPYPISLDLVDCFVYPDDMNA